MAALIHDEAIARGSRSLDEVLLDHVSAAMLRAATRTLEHSELSAELRRSLEVRGHA